MGNHLPKKIPKGSSGGEKARRAVTPAVLSGLLSTSGKISISASGRRMKSHIKKIRNRGEF